MDDSASEHSVDGDNLSNDAYLAKLFSRGSRLGAKNPLLGTIKNKASSLALYEDMLRLGSQHTVEEIAEMYHATGPEAGSEVSNLRKRISNRFTEAKDFIVKVRAATGLTKPELTNAFNRAKLAHNVDGKKNNKAATRRRKDKEADTKTEPEGTIESEVASSSVMDRPMQNQKRTGSEPEADTQDITRDDVFGVPGAAAALLQLRADAWERPSSDSGTSK